MKFGEVRKVRSERIQNRWTARAGALALLLLAGTGAARAESIQLEWDPTPSSSEVVAYVVHARALKSGEEFRVVESEDRIALIEGLDASEGYEFWVTGRTIYGWETEPSNRVVWEVRGSNEAPSLSAVGYQWMREDEAGRTIEFEVGDRETAPEALKVTAWSSNPALMPESGLELGGAGAKRALTMRPAANASGTGTITLSVRDEGGLESLQTFKFRVSPVDDPPSIQGGGNLIVAADETSVAVEVMIDDLETPCDRLVVRAASLDPDLVRTEAMEIGGSGSKRVLKIKPEGMAGTANVRVLVEDEAGNCSDLTLSVTILAAGSPPLLSAIPAQTCASGGIAGPIPFTVEDKETPAEGLAVSAWSTDETLVRSSDIEIRGTGRDRELTLRSVRGAGGVAVIRVRVTDAAGQSAEAAFEVAISENEAPTIAEIPYLWMKEDEVSRAIEVLVADAESPADRLEVSAESSNPSLVSENGFEWSGSGASRVLRIRPEANANGRATITVTARDEAGLATRRSFNMKVASINDLPEIAGLRDLTLTAGAASGWVEWTVSDVDSPIEALTITAASSDSSVVRSENIVIEGTGETRTLQVLPESKVGTASITVRVEDDAGDASEYIFQVAVEGTAKAGLKALGSELSDGLATLDISGKGGEILLSFDTAPGTVIHIQATDSLLPSAKWSTLASVSGTGAPQLWAASAIQQNVRFFRLQIEAAEPSTEAASLR